MFNKSSFFDFVRHATFACLLGCIMLISGCVAPVKEASKPQSNQLVFPPPPDEPRFYFERTIRGSADVIAEDKDSDLRKMLTGEAQTSDGFNKPYAVAVRKGKIYVSDSAERLVRVFDIPQGKYSKIGDDEEGGALAKPMGLDVDSAGNVYVADVSLKSVMVYDSNGKFQKKIGGPNFFRRLSSVTVDSVRNRLYVVDIGGVTSNDHHRVRVFDTRNGTHLLDIGKRGTGPGEMNLPRDVAIGKNGHVYVVDGGNFRILVFDENGKFVKNFGNVGKQLGNFARPKEIAIDGDGNVYVVDSAFGNFQIFSPEGELLMFIGDRGETDAPARYMLPSGIAVDEDGRVYMLDQWYKKLEIFRPASLAERDGYLGKRPPVKAAVKN